MKAKSQAVTPFALTPVNLEALGLRIDDVAEIQQVAERIETRNPTTVAEFGRDVAEHTSGYADQLLDQVQNHDLKESGEKLTQVVNVARSLNLGALSDKRSTLPVIGPWIDMIRMRSTNFMGQFDSTREQIEALMDEVQATQGNIQQRNEGLESMHGAVRHEHRLLGVHIAAGRLRLVELRQEAEDRRASASNDTAEAQALGDLEAMIANLDKRVGDMVALQHSAMQSLPTIRMIQANNQMLVDKFHTIREITVPSWKRQFMLALTLNEQRNAVELATNIDDATNSLLKRNAEMLHQNSVATAKANQRLVIDVDTLQSVQDMLIKTVDDVRQTYENGVAQRKDAETRIAAMREDLHQRLALADREAAAATGEIA